MSGAAAGLDEIKLGETRKNQKEVRKNENASNWGNFDVKNNKSRIVKA